MDVKMFQNASASTSFLRACHIGNPCSGRAPRGSDFGDSDKKESIGEGTIGEAHGRVPTLFLALEMHASC